MTTADRILRAKQDLDDAFEAGKAQGGDSWYDTFWDTFQQNGNRKNYSGAFSSGNAVASSIGWTNAIFKPKYSMVNVSGYSLFDYSGIEGSLTEILNDLGITLTFNGYQSNGFQQTQFTEVDYINNNMSTMVNVFKNNTKLKTLKISTVKESSTFKTCFDGCTALENLTIVGTIGANGFDVHWSTLLSADSLDSIINALSTTATGVSITLPAYDTVKATYDAVYGEGAWDAIVAEKSNWTIAYS